MSQVLVFPEDYIKGQDVSGVCYLKDLNEHLLAQIFDTKTYIDRDLAEKSPEWKQLIPYCVLLDKKNRIFSYERTKKGGESRLHNKHSIGVGGHIEMTDGETDDGIVFVSTYVKGLLRELEEEVGLTHDNFVGNSIVSIYDDSDEVGKVHFGIVHQVFVDDVDKLVFKDESLANGVWKTKDELLTDVDNYENWSKLIIKDIIHGSN